MLQALNPVHKTRMKLETTQQYVQELGRAQGRYAQMLEIFGAFRASAEHVAADNYPIKGIALTNVSPTEFTVNFLEKTVRFTFSYDHTALRGVVAVTAAPAPDGEPTGPNWSFQFNGEGEVGDIEPRAKEGAYNVRVDTDAAEIVLGALQLALVGRIEAARA